MARHVLVLLFVAEILMLQQAVAIKSEVNPVGVKSDETEDDDEPTGVVSGIAADQPVSSHTDSSDNDSREAAAPEIRRLGKHHQHRPDGSGAGGVVIIGGLVTAVFAAVFCYIRVTRKKNTAPS